MSRITKSENFESININKQLQLNGDMKITHNSLIRSNTMYATLDISVPETPYIIFMPYIGTINVSMINATGAEDITMKFLNPFINTSEQFEIGLTPATGYSGTIMAEAIANGQFIFYVSNVIDGVFKFFARTA